MREINGLDSKILDLMGSPIPADQTGRHATVLDVLLNFVGVFRGQTAKDDIKIVSLAERLVGALKGSVGSLVVEEQELSLLFMAVEQNKIGAPAIVRAPVYKTLQDAKEVSDIIRKPITLEVK